MTSDGMTPRHMFPVVDPKSVYGMPLAFWRTTTMTR